MNKVIKFSLAIIFLSASVAAGEATLDIENNTQRAGSDYINFVTESPEQCAKECARDYRCLAFDYSRYDSRCWLKNRVPHPRFNRDVVSGIKIPSKTDGSGSSRKKRVEGMLIDPDTQRPFGDYTNFVVESAEKCAGECVRDDQCLAFDYNRYDRRCWLKNRVPQSRYNKDIVSGVKQWNSSTDRDTGSYMESNGSGNQPAANTRQFDTRVQSAQDILRQEGYNPGPADGIMGKKTKNAVKKFQQDHNLSPTGILDKKTYDLLLYLKAVAPVD